MTAPAGWYPDPREAFDYRWWDGTRWTERVTEEGVEATSPLPADLHPAAPDTAERRAAPVGDREGDATSGAGSAPSASSPSDTPTSSTPQPTAQAKPQRVLALAVAIALLGLGLMFAITAGAGEGEPEDDETDAPFGMVQVDIE